MKSEILSNCLTDDLLSRAKIFIKTLLLSDFNTYQGIPISADIPRCCTYPVLNIKRPAVLRIYYGVSEYSVSSPYVVRPTYGPTRLYSSVGIDPNRYITKQFTPELYLISNHLRHLVETYSVTGFKKMLSHDYNHCTVLIYRSNESCKSNSSLSYHCDTTYDAKGKFVKSSNSQLEKSSVLVLTLGDARQLKYALRYSFGNKWIMSNVTIPSKTLQHNCVYILHCEDEIPTKRDGSKYLSQIMHGGIAMSGKDELSIALCFRFVTKKRSYDPVSNLLVTEPKDMSAPNIHKLTLDKYKEFTNNELTEYQTSFQTFIQEKFKSWGWFT